MADKPVSLPKYTSEITEIFRGFSAIFWSLPMSLITSVHTSLNSLAQTSDFAFPVASFGLMAFGAHSVRRLSIPSENRWKLIVESIRFLAVAQVMLSPFILFHTRMAESKFFAFSILILGVFWILYFRLTIVMVGKILLRIGDSSIRRDYYWMRGFIEGSLLLVGLGWVVLFLRNYFLDAEVLPLYMLIATPHWLGSFLLISIIFPVTVAMNLIWKTKDLLVDYALMQDHKAQFPETFKKESNESQFS